VTARLAPYPTLTGSEPCRQPDVDADWWFSGDTGDKTAAQLLCLRCPIREECLAYALDHPADTEFGIWAATTPNRRRTLRAEYGTTTETDDDTTAEEQE
jgi:hypothetical protein